MFLYRNLLLFFNLNLLSKSFAAAYILCFSFSDGRGMKEGTTVIVDPSVSKSAIFPFPLFALPFYLSNFSEC